MVVIEAVASQKHVQICKGEQKNPLGRDVKAKSGLNRGILDQGWGMFSSMLDYKLEELRRPACESPSSSIQARSVRRCSYMRQKRIRKTQSRFECENCGHTANADDVAAINILARGHRVLACMSRFAWNLR